MSLFTNADIGRSPSLVLTRQLRGDAQDSQKTCQTYRTFLPGALPGDDSALIRTTDPPGACHARAPTVAPTSPCAGTRGDAAPYSAECGGLRVSYMHCAGVQAGTAKMWAFVLCAVSCEDAEAAGGAVSNVQGAVSVSCQWE